MFQISNNRRIRPATHALRAGADFIYNDDHYLPAIGTRHVYVLVAADFMAGTYNNAGFTQTFGETAVEQSNPNVGVYVQDEWQRGPGLTINPGLRYDPQFLDTIKTDANNVSPRPGCVDAVRVTPHWSCAATPGCSSIACRCARGQRAALREQHDRRVEAPAGQRQPVARHRQAHRFSSHPAGAGTARHLRQSDHDAAGTPERLFAAGQRRSRATMDGSVHPQRSVFSTCEGRGC